ncbi:malate synthase A [Sedimenticola hydrogenitrophicus]|uniref:malate synthase A n=1 Tax=Sedimenticola hydrogenitrophicus TaxID=2967975 RepID=UPI0021A454E1|nr:malate synthase A [Sedimenticola hydrogenitrophicus]
MTAVQLSTQTTGQRIRVNAPLAEGHERILLPEALQLVADLERRFGKRRKQLLGLRADRQRRLNAGELPGFRVETAELRASEWRVKQAPADLQDRRVEITGAVERKSVINALNSGANCFMADFEDSHSPTWRGTIEGQLNLYQAVRGTLGDPEPDPEPDQEPDGHRYRLQERRATLMVRPRGWHLEEKHLEVDGQPVSASLFDFGLFMFHNGVQLLEQGSGPYFYLPKLEGYIEAQLWADVFAYAEESLGLNHGSICCTLLIETLPAAFEMEEMLYTLRDYAVGLASGPRDYLFSCIKRLHAHPEWVLPERSQIPLESDFLRACSQLLIKTCHRRGAHAIGGMAARIPLKDDPAAAARNQASADTAREANDGHDGTRVAHPALVPLAKAVFDRIMPRANQLDRQLDELSVSEADLLEPPTGRITAAGLDYNISAGLRYLAAWLDGRGTVPLHNLMEDVATAEFARAQIWQWIRYPKGILEDGRNITLELFSEGVAQELEQIRQEVGPAAFAAGHYPAAANLFSELIANDRFVEFLTLPAYQTLA